MKKRKYKKEPPGKRGAAAARRILNNDRYIYDDPQSFEADAIKVARMLLRVVGGAR